MKRIHEEEYGYKTLSSELEHENPYYKIYKESVSNPHGKILKYWIMERDDFSVSIPLLPNNMTILVGQYRIPVDMYSWEFPMGYVKEAGPLPMAQQELAEETGYTAQKWTPIGSCYMAPGTMNRKMHFFVAEEVTAGHAQPEETESLQLRKVTIAEVKDLIQSGKIVDSPTIIGFHYLEAYLKAKK